MDNITFEQNISHQYCFPDNNASCRKEVHTSPDKLFLYIFLSCVSLGTVFLNLLVIISISHFKQLHTPTNLLILSLAVADLLVGLIVMPVYILQLIDTCWYFGNLGCSIFQLVSYFLSSESLCNLVFIAIDRFIAINDPLLYTSRITVCRTSMCIILGWSCTLLYITLFMYFNNHLLPSQMSPKCYGECALVLNDSWIIIDLLISFVAPCSVIIILYSVIFNVARRQAKAVKAVINGPSNKQGERVSSSSEIKAAKKLGTVIFVYLACWIPFYLNSLTVESLTTLSIVCTVLNWLIYINSSLNPIIYAVFYSWFRESAKYILTCRIFESSSSRFTVLPEQF